MFIEQLKDIVDKAEDMLNEDLEGERGSGQDTRPEQGDTHQVSSHQPNHRAPSSQDRPTFPSHVFRPHTDHSRKKEPVTHTQTHIQMRTHVCTHSAPRCSKTDIEGWSLFS